MQLPFNPEEWQPIVTALLVSFVGSSTFFYIAFYFIKKAFNALKNKISHDEENGRISRENADKALSIVQSTQNVLVNELVALKQENSSLVANIKLLVDRIEQQEAMFAQLIEEEYNAEE